MTKSVPDYGEPLDIPNGPSAATDEIRRRDGGVAQTHIYGAWRERVAACVNGCAGIPDPAVTIPAMREALRTCMDDLLAFNDYADRGIIADRAFLGYNKALAALAAVERT